MPVVPLPSKRVISAPPQRVVVPVPVKHQVPVKHTAVATPAANPETARPVAAPRPVAAQPVVAQPVVARSTVARPAVARPTIVRPTVQTVARPIVARPVAAPHGVQVPSGRMVATSGRQGNLDDQMPPDMGWGSDSVPQVLDHVRGSLIALKVYGKWGRGLLQLNNGHKLVVTGEALVGQTLGARLALTGVKSTHAKYGEQFEVQASAPDVDSRDAVLNHIRRNYAGVGMAIGKSLVDWHEAHGSLERLKHELIYSPSLVDFSVVTSRPVSLIEGDLHDEQRVTDSLSLRFGDLGIAQPTMGELGNRLYHLAISKRDEYRASNGPSASNASKRAPAEDVDDDEWDDPFAVESSDAAPARADAASNHEVKIEDPAERTDLVAIANRILEHNPYRFVGKVEKLGFAKLDAIGQRLGFKTDSEERVCALVYSALEAASTGHGHTYVSGAQFAATLMALDPGVDFESALELALKNEVPITVETSGERPHYYLNTQWRYETAIRNNLVRRIMRPAKPMTSASPEEVEALVDEVARETFHITLDPSQKTAIVGMLTAKSSIHLLTGGPGCGKTRIEEIALTVLSRLGQLGYALFCAPTGKAAKVLNTRVANFGSAVTLHSLLKYDGSRFRMDGSSEETSLNAKRINVDESSMLDNFAAAGLLHALPRSTHLILMGDFGQLEPIAPGAVFNAILSLDDLPGVDHHHLTVTHRNQGGILALVNAVSKGEWPTDPAVWQQWDQDGSVHFTGEMPEPTPDEMQRLARAIAAAAKRAGGDENGSGLANIGVLCPKRKGDPATPGWNVTYLNSFLREVFNPDPDADKKVPGTNLRRNDRIIITRNMSVDDAGANPQAVREYMAMASTRQEDDDPDDETKVWVVNGDTGWLREVVMGTDHGVKMPVRAILQLDDGRVVGYPASEFESLGLAYATTVHAAQGSEFTEVFALCPDGPASFIHRRMLLTELSRAKDRLHIYGDAKVLRDVAARDAPVRNCALAERVRSDLSENLRRIEAARSGGDHESASTEEQAHAAPMRERARA